MTTGADADESGKEKGEREEGRGMYGDEYFKTKVRSRERTDGEMPSGKTVTTATLSGRMLVRNEH